MATVQLDHIVILLPYAAITTPPKWLTQHFTISPGGRHGDNKTENRLIVFKDGSYIELIAFIDDNPAHKAGHWWGDKGHGIIDYAFRLEEGPEVFPAVQKRLADLGLPADWIPQDLRDGSRVKPDGEKIEWKVAFPQASARGKAPFWCFDVTPRERRVPTDPKLTTHPSGVKGVGNLMVFADEAASDFAQLQKLMNALLPLPEEEVDDTTWDLASPMKIESLVPSQLCLMPAKQQYERNALQRGRALVARLSLLVDEDAGGADIGAIRQTVDGDQLLIGFVGA